MGNARDLVEKFKEEYGEGLRQTRKEDQEFCKGELLGRYTAKMLYE